MGEFELIKRYFSNKSLVNTVAHGIGDDCAIVNLPAGKQLAISTDTLVEGSHFFPNTSGDKVATRLLGAALSDLAAAGAEPVWLTLNLTLPRVDEVWLQAFSSKLLNCCQLYNISLIGGDTTKGALNLTAQVHGFVPKGQAILRSGAAVGDIIFASGTLGDSRAGLEQLSHKIDSGYLIERFYSPTPRIALGQALLGLASSCIDISDGLIADLQHLLNASGGLGADIELNSLPLSNELCHCYGLAQSKRWALAGGEDFELCFTLPPDKISQLNSLPDRVTPIGKVTAKSKIELYEQGKSVEMQISGYEHFVTTEIDDESGS